MATSRTFVSSAEVKPAAQMSGVDRRTLVWGDQMLLAEMTIAKGTRVQRHSHVHEQLGYLAKGRLEFVVGEERTVLEAGAGYRVPSNAPHEVYALEDSLVLDIFSPVREEYLP